MTEVKPNAAVDIKVPDNVRQAGNPYTRVQSQKASEGVWYVTGGSHHSVVIEMSDHLIVAEGPAQRRPGPGRHCRGPQARTRQADQVPDRQPSPLRPLRRCPRVRGRGRHDHHPRRGPPVLRAHPRHHRDRGPRSSGEVGQEGRGGGRARPPRADRRHADGGDSPHRRHPARRRHADGLPAEGEIPDPGRRLHATRPERGADEPAQPVHRQPSTRTSPSRRWP